MSRQPNLAMPPLPLEHSLVETRRRLFQQRPRKLWVSLRMRGSVLRGWLLEWVHQEHKRR